MIKQVVAEYVRELGYHVNESRTRITIYTPSLLRHYIVSIVFQEAYCAAHFIGEDGPVSYTWEYADPNFCDWLRDDLYIISLGELGGRRYIG